MADSRKSVPENVPGDFFVDTTCIDCDTCRQIAPEVFAEGRGTAFVHRQPSSAAARRNAVRALLACPTGSIGDRADDDRKSVMADFPLLVEEPVYYCGFNSPKSFGGNSYFIEHPEGNWLADSPKFLPQLGSSIGPSSHRCEGPKSCSTGRNQSVSARDLWRFRRRATLGPLLLALRQSLSFHRRSPRFRPRYQAPGRVARLLLVLLASADRVDASARRSSVRVGAPRPRTARPVAC